MQTLLASDSRWMLRPQADLCRWSTYNHMQLWPTFIDRTRLASLQSQASQLVSLLRNIPRRFFDENLSALAHFHALPPGWSELVPPDLLSGMPQTVGRVDFIWSHGRPYFIEYNGTASLGGMVRNDWRRFYEANPWAEASLLRAGLTLASPDPVEALAAHLVRLHGGPAQVMVSVPNRENYVTVDEIDLFVEDLTVAMERLGPGSRVLPGRAYELEITSDRVLLRGNPVHLVVEAFTDGGVFVKDARPLRDRNVTVLNGPLTPLLTSKLNFAILSEHQESELFTAEERELIQTMIPWTRRAVPSLRERLVREQPDIVLKKAHSWASSALHLGCTVSQERWPEIVSQVIGEGDWVAQRYCPSDLFCYQHGPSGCQPHRTVWGLFHIGERWGGGYVRAKPESAGPNVGVTETSESLLVELP